MNKKLIYKIVIGAIVLFGGFGIFEGSDLFDGSSAPEVTQLDSIAEIPEYSGDDYAIINDDVPDFSEKDMEVLSTPGYEYYSAIDSLGRCGYAEACVGEETRPTEAREDISSVRPAGYQSLKFDCVEGGWLWNRGHLIAFTLTGENANDHNLVTQTRHSNGTVMVKFELAVADYIEETGNHVAYRSTPMYKGEELVPRGIWLQGYSIEDEGKGVCFNVFIYNAQPGIEIDYATGDAWEE